MKENAVLGGPPESWEHGKLSGSVLQAGQVWTVRSGLSQRPGGKDLALQVTTWQESSWPAWGHTWQSLCAQERLEGPPGLGKRGAAAGGTPEASACQEVDTQLLLLSPPSTCWMILGKSGPQGSRL